MPTYFGQQIADGTESGAANYTFGNHPNYGDYTCPGSGPQNIVSLGVSCKTSGNIRMAIFSTDYNTRYGQHSAEVAVSGSDYAWWGEAQAISQDAPLTGGVSYVIAVSFDGSGTVIQTKGCAAGLSIYRQQDLTGGFGTTIAFTGGYTKLFLTRCGADPVAAEGVRRNPFYRSFAGSLGGSL